MLYEEPRCVDLWMLEFVCIYHVNRRMPIFIVFKQKGQHQLLKSSFRVTLQIVKTQGNAACVFNMGYQPLALG